jgi:hypothetical protein
MAKKSKSRKATKSAAPAVTNGTALGEWVLVTTAHRGVFFGRLAEDRGEVVTLEEARNCVYWPPATKGFLGLAEQGPPDGSRVGPSVPSLTLRAVTSVARCTPKAEAAWRIGPWKS